MLATSAFLGEGVGDEGAGYAPAALVGEGQQFRVGEHARYVGSGCCARDWALRSQCLGASPAKVNGFQVRCSFPASPSSSASSCWALSGYSLSSAGCFCSAMQPPGAAVLRARAARCWPIKCTLCSRSPTRFCLPAIAFRSECRRLRQCWEPSCSGLHSSIPAGWCRLSK